MNFITTPIAVILFLSSIVAVFSHGTLQSHLHRLKLFHRENNSTDSDENQCSEVCTAIDYSVYESLKFYVDKTGNILAFYNSSASVAWVFDLKYKYHALFNGKTGGVIIVNINDQSGVDKSSGVWYSRQTSFEVYIQRFQSLKEIWTVARKDGIYFKLNSIRYRIKEATRNRLYEILIWLEIQYARSLKSNSEFSATILFEYVRLWYKHSGVIQQYFLYHGQVNFKIAGSFRWMASILEGFSMILENIEGGVETLRKYNIKFRLEAISLSYSGLEAFTVVLTDIASKTNIVNVFKKAFLTRYEIFLRVIVLLGGRLRYGLDGYLHVAYNMAVASTDASQMDRFSEVLIDFVYRTDRNTNFAHIQYSVGIIINIINKQISQYQSEQSLTVIRNFFLGIKSSEQTFLGIDLSLFYKTIITAHQQQANRIESLIRILTIFKLSVKFSHTVPSIFYTILRSLSTDIGYAIVRDLNINIKWVRNKEGEIDVLATFRRELKNSSYHKYSKDLILLLQHLPIVKDIYASFSASIKVITKGEYDMAEILRCKGAAAYVKKIVVLLKGQFGIKNIGKDLIEHESRRQNRKYLH